jgi:hypothetical protein
MNSMTHIEVKKGLYRNKPTADQIGETKEFQIWVTNLNGELITFNIPHKEAVDFGYEQPAQLLIRWIV